MSKIKNVQNINVQNQKCPKSKMDNYLQNVRFLKCMIFLDIGLIFIIVFLCLSRTVKKMWGKYINIEEMDKNKCPFLKSGVQALTDFCKTIEK